MKSKTYVVEWITKLGARRGCVNQEWNKRKCDAKSRLQQLKRGGFDCFIWEDIKP